MLFLGAMLILAFGPLDWSFPWWLWGVAVVYTAIELSGTTHTVRGRGPGEPEVKP